MSAAPDTLPRLARALFDRAIEAFRVVPPDERAPLGVYAALDDFLAAPGPAAFLSASRRLGEAARAVRLRRLRAGATERAVEKARAAVACTAGMDAALAARLAALPVDERAADRLHALAALLTAHQELASRVAGAAAAMRRQLAAPPAPPARSSRPTRARRVSQRSP